MPQRAVQRPRAARRYRISSSISSGLETVWPISSSTRSRRRTLRRDTSVRAAPSDIPSNAPVPRSHRRFDRPPGAPSGNQTGGPSRASFLHAAWRTRVENRHRPPTVEHLLRCLVRRRFDLEVPLGGRNLQRQQRRSSASLFRLLAIVLVDHEVLQRCEQKRSKSTAFVTGVTQSALLEQEQPERLDQLLGVVLSVAARARNRYNDSQ